MKKTFCDRCGKECDGVAIQRFVIFDVNKAIDVCDDCYKAFFRWLNNKPTAIDSCDMNMFEPDERVINDDSITKFVKESLVNPIPMDNDKMISISINTLKKIYESNDPEGVEEFIKDVRKEKNDEN